MCCGLFVPVNTSMSAEAFHACLAGKHVISGCRVSPAVDQGHSLMNRLLRTDISFGKIRYSVSNSTDQSIDYDRSMALKRSSRPDAE